MSQPQQKKRNRCSRSDQQRHNSSFSISTKKEKKDEADTSLMNITSSDIFKEMIDRYVKDAVQKALGEVQQGISNGNLNLPQTIQNQVTASVRPKYSDIVKSIPVGCIFTPKPSPSTSIQTQIEPVGRAKTFNELMSKLPACPNWDGYGLIEPVGKQRCSPIVDLHCYNALRVAEWMFGSDCLSELKHLGLNDPAMHASRSVMQNMKEITKQEDNFSLSNPIKLRQLSEEITNHARKLLSALMNTNSKLLLMTRKNEDKVISICVESFKNHLNGNNASQEACFKCDSFSVFVRLIETKTNRKSNANKFDAKYTENLMRALTWNISLFQLHFLIEWFKKNTSLLHCRDGTVIMNKSDIECTTKFYNEMKAKEEADEAEKKLNQQQSGGKTVKREPEAEAGISSSSELNNGTSITLLNEPLPNATGTFQSDWNFLATYDGYCEGSDNERVYSLLECSDKAEMLINVFGYECVTILEAYDAEITKNLYNIVAEVMENGKRIQKDLQNGTDGLFTGEAMLISSANKKSFWRCGKKLLERLIARRDPNAQKLSNEANCIAISMWNVKNIIKWSKGKSAIGHVCFSTEELSSNEQPLVKSIRENNLLSSYPYLNDLVAALYYNIAYFMIHYLTQLMRKYTFARKNPDDGLRLWAVSKALLSVKEEPDAGLHMNSDTVSIGESI